jgi:hypothetical protein
MYVEWMRLTRIFVALKHEHGNSSVRVPELDTSVLRSTENPGAVRGKSNAENKVLD